MDENGNVHYSDKGQKGAEEVKLPAAVTYSPSTRSTASSGKAQPDKKQGYAEMAIVNPKMNETIRSNDGDVRVSISLNPGLTEGDSITLYLDGKEVTKGGAQTSLTLTGLGRGSHTLRASVFNPAGTAVISSRSIIFHLQRESIVTPNNQPTDNTESYKTDYGKELPGKEHTVVDGTVDVNKNFGSEGSYQKGAKDFNKGVPASGGTFTPGTTFTPRYNQKP